MAEGQQRPGTLFLKILGIGCMPNAYDVYLGQLLRGTQNGVSSAAREGAYNMM